MFLHVCSFAAAVILLHFGKGGNKYQDKHVQCAAVYIVHCASQHQSYWTDFLSPDPFLCVPDPDPEHAIELPASVMAEQQLLCQMELHTITSFLVH